MTAAPAFRQFTSPDDVTPRVRRTLVECWVEVTNAGGAAGFPFPPVDTAAVAPALDRVAERLSPGTDRLLTATVDGELAGWLVVRRDPFELVAHWGTVHHVQTRTAVRGRGIGRALMEEARGVAREEMGLEQLRLAVRDGLGLEDFYGRLGWREVGRWPGALRLAADDDRDEILMLLAPL
ncbi:MULTISPECIES: GNAT family N-acetyltransferase [unclassified Streptomyces]|uniref:GNAT family N-acetyltransferase n=1 Tax=unclassified Streptomyces TaxID=2593676 RepID=UPI0006AEB8B9|nr:MULTISPECIES: GNAT family N-acetyltransferase [unclassified Streptomyces]KOX24700.1 acetyltransferase [Streptomyces sp. NRRL F-6491]KOX38923.1 acetyltransferase [Streptomyces sp. NRRL F-6492]